MTDDSRAGVPNPIVDNRRRRVGDFLRNRIRSGSIYRSSLRTSRSMPTRLWRDALDGVNRVRFLYGDPQGVGAMDPQGNQPRSFHLRDDNGSS